MKNKLYMVLAFLLATFFSAPVFSVSADVDSGLLELVMTDTFSTPAIDSLNWINSEGTGVPGGLSIVDAHMLFEPGASVYVNRPATKNTVLEFSFSMFDKTVAETSTNYYTRIDFMNTSVTPAVSNITFLFRPGVVSYLRPGSGEITLKANTVDNGRNYFARIEMLGTSATLYIKSPEAAEYTNLGTVSNISETDCKVRFTATSTKVTLDDVSVYKYKEFNAELEPVSDVNVRPGTKLRLGFSLPVNSDTLSGITLNKTGGSNVLCNVVATGGGEAEITVGDWLEYDSQYEVHLENVRGTFGHVPSTAAAVLRFTTRDEPLPIEFTGLKCEKLTGGVYQTVTRLEAGAIRVTVDALNTTSSDADAVLLAVLGNGTESRYGVEYIAKRLITVPKGDEGAQTVFEIEVPPSLSNPLIKIMACDSLLDAGILAESAIITK
jgi:hypothetical protein